MTPQRAIAIQEHLRHTVVRRDQVGRIRTIAGVDISVRDDCARAATVVLDAKTLVPIDMATAEDSVRFPYVPGLLSFREIPLLLKTWRRLKTKPDLIVVDGHGLAHPRRFGIACHLGVTLDTPAIGCGKSLFVGTHRPVAHARGSWAPLKYGPETIGAAVRTQDGVNVVYASIGHRVSLSSAIRWILRTSTRYRLPEPTRLAHHTAGQWDSSKS